MIDFEGFTVAKARAIPRVELFQAVRYCSDQIRDIRLRQIEAQIANDYTAINAAVPQAELWMARLSIIEVVIKEMT